MPVVLTQQCSADDRVHEDVEFLAYHYPRVYSLRVNAYERFIYYRPLGKNAKRPDSLHYFGHGILGQPFEDSRRPDHRFVPLIKSEPFTRLVPLRDTSDAFYETENRSGPQFQAAVRRISDIAYHRILAASGTLSTPN